MPVPTNPFMQFGPAKAWSQSMALKPAGANPLLSWGPAAAAARLSPARPEAGFELGTRVTRGMGASAGSIDPAAASIETRTYGEHAPTDYMVGKNGASHLAMAVSRTVAIAAAQTRTATVEASGMHA